MSIKKIKKTINNTKKYNLKHLLNEIYFHKSRFSLCFVFLLFISFDASSVESSSKVAESHSLKDYIIDKNINSLKIKENLLPKNKISKQIERYKHFFSDIDNKNYRMYLDSIINDKAYKNKTLKIGNKIQNIDTDSNWLEIGPFDKIKSSNPNTFGNGRINCVKSIIKNDNEELYIGTALGGIWHSIDQGKSWKEFEIDDFIFRGISDILLDVDLKDSNGILHKYDIVFASGDSQGDIFFPFFSSVFGYNKQDNKIVMLFRFVNYEEPTRINRLLYYENSIILGSNLGLFSFIDISENNNVNNSKTLLGFKNENIRDMCLIDNKLLLSTMPKNSNENAELHIFDLLTKTSQKLPLDEVDGINDKNLLRMAFTQNNDINSGQEVYILATNNTNFDTECVLKYNLSSNKITNIPINIDPVFKQGFYNLSIERSPYEENTFYLGGVKLYKTSDNFQTFTDVGSIKNGIHVDHHHLYFSKLFNKIYSANDGGLFVKNVNTSINPIIWDFTSNGISANQAYSINYNYFDDKLYINSQDNGIFYNDLSIFKDIKQSPNSILKSDFVGLLSGDGITTSFCQINPFFTFFTLPRSEFYYSIKNQNNIKKIDLDAVNSNTSNWITNYKFNESEVNNLYYNYNTVNDNLNNNVKDSNELNKIISENKNVEVYYANKFIYKLKFDTNKEPEISKLFSETPNNEKSNIIDDFLVDFDVTNQQNLKAENYYTNVLVNKADKLYYFDNANNQWDTISLGFDYFRIRNMYKINLNQKTKDSIKFQYCYILNVVYKLGLNSKTQLVFLFCNNNFEDLKIVKFNLYRNSNIDVVSLSLVYPINQKNYNYNFDIDDEINNEKNPKYLIECYITTHLNTFKIPFNFLDFDNSILYSEYLDLFQNNKLAFLTNHHYDYKNDLLFISSYGRGSFVKSIENDNKNTYKDYRPKQQLKILQRTENELVNNDFVNNEFVNLKNDTIYICRNQAISLKIDTSNYINNSYNVSDYNLFLWSNGHLGNILNLNENEIKQFIESTNYIEVFQFNENRMINNSQKIYFRYFESPNLEFNYYGNKFCPTDSIVVEVLVKNVNGQIDEYYNNKNENFVWSDNVKSKVRTINKSGNYTVFINDTNNCQTSTISMEIEINSKNNINLIKFQDSLTYEIRDISNNLINLQNSIIDWYINDNLIEEFNNLKSIKIDSLGDYKVRITFKEFCVEFSNTFKNNLGNNIEVNIYPNPSNANFNVEINNPNKKSIGYNIYDNNGKLIKNIYLGNSIKYNNIENLTQYAAGDYYLTIIEFEGNTNNYSILKDISPLIIKNIK